MQWVTVSTLRAMHVEGENFVWALPNWGSILPTHAPHRVATTLVQGQRYRLIELDHYGFIS